MADTSVAAVNTPSKEATLIPLSASQPRKQYSSFVWSTAIALPATLNAGGRFVVYGRIVSVKSRIEALGGASLPKPARDDDKGEPRSKVSRSLTSSFARAGPQRATVFSDFVQARMS